MANTPDVPAEAEELDLYEHYSKVLKPSRFAPGCEAMHVRFTCPGCAKDIKVPRDFAPTPCPHCELTILVRGTSLHVWRQTAEAR